MSLKDASVPMVVFGLPLMLIVQVASQAITHWRLTEVEKKVVGLEGRGRVLGEGLAEVRDEVKAAAEESKAARKSSDKITQYAETYMPRVDAMEKTMRECSRTRRCFN